MEQLAGGDLDALVTERRLARRRQRILGTAQRAALRCGRQPLGPAGIITDITEYKRLVASLRAVADDLRKAQSVCGSAVGPGTWPKIAWNGPTRSMPSSGWIAF